MNGNELARMTEKELLRLHGAAINELRRRKVVRTQNNPVGDYTEWLVSRALDLKLEGNSAIGYDAINERGIRYQIKGRRLAQKNHACQLIRQRGLGIYWPGEHGFKPLSDWKHASSGRLSTPFRQPALSY